MKGGRDGHEEENLSIGESSSSLTQTTLGLLLLSLLLLGLLLMLQDVTAVVAAVILVLSVQHLKSSSSLLFATELVSEGGDSDGGEVFGKICSKSAVADVDDVTAGASAALVNVLANVVVVEAEDEEEAMRELPSMSSS